MSHATLQVGEELLLDGAIRVTVLAVEGDTVVLGITGHGDARPVPPEAPGGRVPAPAAVGAWRNDN
jgi:hypothetical protein